MHTDTPPAGVAAAVLPDPDGVLRYLDILRDLAAQGASVNTALVAAHTADTRERRRAALTVLHTRLRAMAATANQALADAPDPDEVTR